MKELKIAFISAVSAITVAALGFAGGYWIFAVAEEQQVAVNREIDIKMIDVALAILAGEKGVEGENQSVEARRFAVRVLRQYSAIKPKLDDDKPIKWDDWAQEVNQNLKIDRGIALSSSKNEYSKSVPNWSKGGFDPDELEIRLSALKTLLDAEVAGEGDRSPGFGPKARQIRKEILKLESRLRNLSEENASSNNSNGQSE
ncbi:MAG: hypothetical protein WBC71_08815 [Salaquimonas sp.]